MDLKPHDLHMILDAANRRLKLFDADGMFTWGCEARNRTVRDGQLGHWGNCPPGEYVLGKPVYKDTPPFGRWFIPILDYGDHHGMADHGRAGIGIHGGGSGLPNSFAPQQGWVPTHGCWRLQNQDLIALEWRVAGCQGGGGTVYVTVVAPAPGAAPGDADDYVNTPEDQLDPEE